MAIIRTKLKNIITFNLNAQTQIAIKRNETKVEGLNKGQLSEGLKADGSEMPAYSAATVVAKRGRNAPVPASSTFNLQDSGALWIGMFVNAERSYMTITSNDPELSKKLNDNGLVNKDAFGLTPESKKILCDQILVPHFMTVLKR